jgi:hypothetical protein
MGHKDRRSERGRADVLHMLAFKANASHFCTLRDECLRQGVLKCFCARDRRPAVPRPFRGSARESPVQCAEPDFHLDMRPKLFGYAENRSDPFEVRGGNLGWFAPKSAMEQTMNIR